MMLNFPAAVDRPRVSQTPLKVYFFLAGYGESAATTPYQHTAIAIAEGLSLLAIPFVSNIDYWHAAPGAAPLFQADPRVDPRSCGAVVFTRDWMEQGLEFPSRLFNGPDRPITVYIETTSHKTALRSLERDFPKFDVVLRVHYNAAMPYPATFRPWAFGLSNRIIDATKQLDPAEARAQQILVSHRHRRFPHSVRLNAERAFLDKISPKLPVFRSTDDFILGKTDPLAEHLWRVTGRRHSDQFYTDLRRSVSSACFGGYFLSRWPRDERHVVSRFVKRAVGPLGVSTNRITQFDSWRLWESLAAGCAAIHLDLKKYGAVLPVMPRNWEHYIGLDLEHVDQTIVRMLREPDLLHRIGASGRAWSIATYGPQPTAERFLTLIGAPVGR
jgi:hypothetical protein